MKAYMRLKSPAIPRRAKLTSYFQSASSVSSASKTYCGISGCSFKYISLNGRLKAKQTSPSASSYERYFPSSSLIFIGGAL